MKENRRKRAAAVIALVVSASLCFARGNADTSSSGRQVTIEFMQWWEPENPGILDSIISRFEAENPDIKISLNNKPFNDIQSQVTIAAASGTLSDLVSLNPRWAYDLAKQNAVVDLNVLLANDGEFDGKYEVTQVDGKGCVLSYQNFIYPLFYNTDYFKEAGIANPPDTWAELRDAVAKITNPNQDRHGLAWGLNIQTPNTIMCDLFSYIWAMDGSVFPRFNTPANADAFQFLADLYNAGYITPGALVAAEQDKIERFTSGRAAMMLSTLALINTINRRNPNLHYDIAPVPVKDGYNGKRNFYNTAWGIGIAEGSTHKEETWRFVKFLLQASVCTEIADVAHAFPGHADAAINWINENDLYRKAFAMYQQMGSKNEAHGAPRANRLCGIVDEQFQLYLQGNQTFQQFMSNAQSQIDEIYAEAAR